MKKIYIVDHLEAAIALAKQDNLSFVAYLIAMAITAMDQSKKEAA